MLAYYTHQLSPFIVRFSDHAGLRWYGFAYVHGVCLRLLAFARPGQTRLRRTAAGKSGRFHYLRRHLRSHAGRAAGLDPLLWLARYPGRSMERLSNSGRAACPATGAFWGWSSSRGSMRAGKKSVGRASGTTWSSSRRLGCFFGRLANFINGELWGRIITAPTPPPVGDAFPRRRPRGVIRIWSPERMRIIRLHWRPWTNLLPLRHPSQLYEAFLEGVVLFTTAVADPHAAASAGRAC